MEVQENKQAVSLAVLEEQYKNLSGKLNTFIEDTKSHHTEQAKQFDRLIEELARLNQFAAEIFAMKDKLVEIEKNVVMKVEFDPVKRVVYGEVTVVLVSVLTALVYLVVKR